MSYVFISERAYAAFADAFRSAGYVPISLPAWERLENPARDHPDMLLCPLPDGSILVYGAYYRANRDCFAAIDNRIRLYEAVPAPVYPADIALNALICEKTAYGHLKTAESIKKTVPAFIPVKQGYARCSSLLVDNTGDRPLLITADQGIASAFKAYSGEVLTVSSGGIRLPGYDFGFLGGASVYDRLQKRAIFFGNLSSYPDGQAITAALTSRGIEILSLSVNTLWDCGGGVVVSDRALTDELE